MVSLVVLFWIFVVLFAIIGAMRGWGRELLVSFSVILGLFIITVMERYVPFVRDFLATNPKYEFWFRTATILVMVMFGYQTPNIPRLAQKSTLTRERLQDVLLGLFLGALNGWLVVGSIWYYMDEANYPLANIMGPPTDTNLAAITDRMMNYMPPHLLTADGSTAIFFAVALAFVFVLVVFI